MDGEVDGWYFPSLDGVPGPRTVVLIGRTGNGKSATGNSILGKKAFKSGLSMSGITSNLDFQTTTLKNGEVLNVIDTPGMFDVSKEIVKCVDLAKDGIHALLLVLSVNASVRFTEEEAAVIMSLQTIFGPNITKYMIVVFTGGDNLEKDQSLEEFLSYGCPHPLQKILHACENRMVLFDNNTTDRKKKTSQRQQLFSLVDKVIEENGGQPYTKNLCSEIRVKEEEVNAFNGHTKKEPIELMEKMQKSYDEQLKQMMEMVESKLKETNEKLQQQLTEETAARLNAEKIAKDVQKQSKDEIQKLKNNLAKAKKKSEDDVKEVRENLQSQLKEISENFQQQLDEEIAAHLIFEKFAQDAQKQSKDEIQKLKNNLAKAKKKSEDDIKALKTVKIAKQQ